MKTTFVLIVCLLWKESVGYYIEGCVNGTIDVDLTRKDITFTCSGIGPGAMSWNATLFEPVGYGVVSTCPYTVNAPCKQYATHYIVTKGLLNHHSKGVYSVLKVLRKEALVEGGKVGCGPTEASAKSKPTSCKLHLIRPHSSSTTPGILGSKPPTEGEDEGDGFPLALVAGGVAGGVVLITLVVVLIIILTNKRRKDDCEEHDNVCYVSAAAPANRNAGNPQRNANGNSAETGRAAVPTVHPNHGRRGRSYADQGGDAGHYATADMEEETMGGDVGLYSTPDEEEKKMGGDVGLYSTPDEEKKKMGGDFGLYSTPDGDEGAGSSRAGGAQAAAAVQSPDVYAEVNKPKAKQEAQPDVYAVVNKPKAKQEVQPDVYAVVNKPKAKQEAKPELYAVVNKPKKTE